jgi:hypothetical protein
MRVVIVKDEKDMAQALKVGLEEEIPCQPGLRWRQWVGSGAGVLLRREGEGLIYVFQMNDPDHYRLPTKVPTALGGRTPGYFGRQKKGMHRFIWLSQLAAGRARR